jgi:hypothetical protein
MRSLLTTMLLAGALSLVSIQAYACADGPACAVVTKTPDGFLNLRRAPTAKAPVVTKLRPGDRLYIWTDEGDQPPLSGPGGMLV